MQIVLSKVKRVRSSLHSTHVWIGYWVLLQFISDQRNHQRAHKVASKTERDATILDCITFKLFSSNGVRGTRKRIFEILKVFKENT